MASTIVPTPYQDCAWFVAIPSRVEFTKPEFHFGERVKFWQGERHDRSWETGRIIGMKFVEPAQWRYTITLDETSALPTMGVQEVTAEESELRLVKDTCAIREQLQSEQQWFQTVEAAKQLSITPEQLRKLRLNGLFKVSYHYRDTSVPGSGLPRWQWHLDRCSQALGIPPEKRRMR
jgi:hypothetical protein